MTQIQGAFQRIALAGIAAFLLALATASAQVTFYQNARRITTDNSFGLLSATPTRNIIDLNGRWRYRLFDSEEWQEVFVPSSYTGTHRIVFEREFSVSGQKAYSSVFQFIAFSISYYCEIRINNQFVGNHSGDASFGFKISPGIIRAGTNTITITVDNSLNANSTVPPKERLWDKTYYGGIVHDIGIAAMGEVWAQENYIYAEVQGEGRPATVFYTTYLNSGQFSRPRTDSTGTRTPGGRTAVDHFIEIVDPATGEVVVRSETKRIPIEADRLIPVDITVTVPSVRLWSPEIPNLYVVRQHTMIGNETVDIASFTTGFRSVGTRAGSILLNGSPYFIKGIGYFEDSWRHGRSLSFDELERDVLLIKNTGANTVRLPFGFVHPYLLSLCDRYGLLVLQDLPLSGVPVSLLQRNEITITARNALREMTSRDSYHPSVIALGLGQRIDGTQPGFSTFIDRVVQKSHGFKGKLLYASFTTPLQEELPELAFYALDAVPSDAKRTLAMIDAVKEKIGETPIVVSSLFYPVEIDNYNGYSDPRSLDAQAQFFLELYPEIRSRECAGAMAAAFSDWNVRIPIMEVDRAHEYIATAGIVDLYRQKRLAYDILKAKFNNEKAPVISIGTVVDDHPAIFVVVGIILILIFALVYNVFRRFRENVVRSFLRPHNFFTDIRDQRMLSVFQTSVVGLVSAASASLFIANMLFYWRTNHIVDTVLSLLIEPLWLKQWVNYAAWNPFENILVTTAALYLLLLVFALFLRMITFFSKISVLLFDTYSVAMWSALPAIVLAPLGMILYRIMNLPIVEGLSLAALLWFIFWVFSRLLHGTAIVLDLRPRNMYFIGYIVLIITVGGALFALNGGNEVFAYASYVSNMWLFLQKLPGILL